MIKISTPATSANLSVGFDALGISFNRFNEFLFEESTTFEVKHFDAAFTVEKNLVIASYVAFAKANQVKKIKPVKVTLLEENIPISRGLGSSASCIVAGVLAANEMHMLNKPLQECAAFASDVEGHPDNVFACAFGNLTATFQSDLGYVHQSFSVSENLVFTLLIPSTKGSTKELRDAIQKEVSIEDAVFHLSRMIHVPKAFESGDYDLLQHVLQDRLHEQYRYPFIPRFSEILELKKKYITCISGSGPSILLISTSSIQKELKHLSDTFLITEVQVSNGVKVEVLS